MGLALGSGLLLSAGAGALVSVGLAVGVLLSVAVALALGLGLDVVRLIQVPWLEGCNHRIAQRDQIPRNLHRKSRVNEPALSDSGPARCLLPVAGHGIAVGSSPE